MNENILKIIIGLIGCFGTSAWCFYMIKKQKMKF